MTERKVMRLMRAVHELDIQEREERFVQEWALCLPLSRARALALNPSRWTKDERAHAAMCRRCAHLVESFERNITHPSLWTLILWQLKKLTDDEAQAMWYHLEEGECQRCLAFVRALQVVPFLKRQVEQVRQGMVGAVERTDGFFNGLVWSPEPVRVRAGAFAEEIPYRELASPDETLRIVLQQGDEAEGGRPLLAVEVENGSWTGDHVVVTATDKEGTRVVLDERVPMTRRSAGLWEGQLALSEEQQQRLTEEVWLWGTCVPPV
jgi:hypothetical protein